MRERINITRAIRLYWILRSWREVANRMVRRNGMRFTHDAIQAAVRRHDRGLA
jgi:hypothetical protein